jgi:hypothetical protein
MTMKLLEGTRDRGLQSPLVMISIVYLMDDTPRTIEKAYSSPDADYWKEAIQSKMDSIMSNDTWEVVECWVF